MSFSESYDIPLLGLIQTISTWPHQSRPRPRWWQRSRTRSRARTTTSRSKCSSLPPRPRRPRRRRTSQRTTRTSSSTICHRCKFETAPVDIFLNCGGVAFHKCKFKFTRFLVAGIERLLRIFHLVLIHPPTPFLLLIVAFKYCRFFAWHFLSLMERNSLEGPCAISTVLSWPLRPCLLICWFTSLTEKKNWRAKYRLRSVHFPDYWRAYFLVHEPWYYLYEQEVKNIGKDKPSHQKLYHDSNSNWRRFPVNWNQPNIMRERETYFNPTKINNYPKVYFKKPSNTDHVKSYWPFSALKSTQKTDDTKMSL